MPNIHIYNACCHKRLSTLPQGSDRSDVEVGEQCESQTIEGLLIKCLMMICIATWPAVHQHKIMPQKHFTNPQTPTTDGAPSEQR